MMEPLGRLADGHIDVAAIFAEAGQALPPGLLYGVGNQARRRALKVRHLIERLCAEMLDRFGRATGPQLLAFNGLVAQRHAELALYIRQCHGERNLESIAAR